MFLSRLSSLARPKSPLFNPISVIARSFSSKPIQPPTDPINQISSQGDYKIENIKAKGLFSLIKSLVPDLKVSYSNVFEIVLWLYLFSLLIDLRKFKRDALELERHSEAKMKLNEKNLKDLEADFVLFKNGSIADKLAIKEKWEFETGRKERVYDNDFIIWT